jgi:4-amino-4-deoxy-L-arabinose transferase-like glycosyltransferase
VRAVLPGLRIRQPSIMTSPRNKDLLILCGICFLCFFWRLGSVGLFDFNEGFYTQVAREMYLRGDYVTPRVNGILFFDKPPLAIWLSALSFHLFGVTELAARLPVALAATGLVFLTYLFGARYLGRSAGLLAGAILALNPLVYGTARQMTMDIHQSLWFVVAMFSFCAAWVRGRTSRAGFTAETQSNAENGSGTTESGSRITLHASPAAHRASRVTALLYHTFWAACGLGVLAKSVPGLFPLAVAFVFVAITERFRPRAILARIWEARILTGLPLMFAIAVPWFYLAWRANGRVFYEEFWLLHHVQLARGGDFNHAAPIWYYVPALLAGLFPWSLFLPWAARAATWRPADPTTQRPRDPTPGTRLFLLAWAVVIFVIFSLMKSKLVSYLLPMYPAAALLIGDWMARAWEGRHALENRGLRWGTTIVSTVALVALGVGIAVAHYIITSPAAARQRQDVPPAVLEFGVHALVVVAIGMTIAAVLAWSRRPKAGVWAMVGGLCAFVILADVEGLNAMEARMNAPLQSLAREAGRKLTVGDSLAIHIGQPRRPSVFFYLPDAAFMGKPLPAPGQDGIILERGEAAPIEAFLNRTGPAWILTDRQRADALITTAPSIRVVDRRDHWLLLYAPARSALAQRPHGSASHL